jgi:pimeloyl-ACP methyl ester carboxylesterase
MISNVPTLLFLPGTLCTEATFAYQARHLTDCSKVQIVPLKQGPTIAASARWIVEQMNEPFALVGFSQGAIVALEIMRLAPERVTKLCLMSANPKAATAKQLETWATWQQEVGEEKFNDIIQGFTNNVHPEKRSDPKLRETILNMAHDTGPETFGIQLQALASRIDSRPYLYDIHCPTLLMVGRPLQLFYATGYGHNVATNVIA